MKKKIGIIILAAGWGRRIGKSKALLKLDDKIYLNFIAEKFAAIEQDKSIIAVINTEVKQYITSHHLKIKYVVNSDPDKGMSSSVKLGLQSLPKHDYYMIYPVDHPNVSLKTIQILLGSLMQKEAYYQPRFQNRNGHPIIIPQTIIFEIIDKLDSPLNTLLKNYRRVLVEVDDSEILRNINYPQDIIKKT